MKVAYFAESPADEAALTILTEAMIGRPTVSVIHAGLRHRGWPTVKGVLAPVLKELHYHTDAEGFVFVVDSNGSPVHAASHITAPERDCRLCQLKRIVDEVRQQLRPVPNRPPLKIALGVAVPAIEAWLLCGVDSHVSEAAWINGMKSDSMPYTKKELKNKVYGTSHPSLAMETGKMMMAAIRLRGNLDLLETSFPSGFGHLRASLRGGDLGLLGHKQGSSPRPSPRLARRGRSKVGLFYGPCPSIGYAYTRSSVKFHNSWHAHPSTSILLPVEGRRKRVRMQTMQ